MLLLSGVSIPKRVSEALKRAFIRDRFGISLNYVSIPKRVSEALKLEHLFRRKMLSIGFNP